MNKKACDYCGVRTDVTLLEPVGQKNYRTGLVFCPQCRAEKIEYRGGVDNLPTRKEKN